MKQVSAYHSRQHLVPALRRRVQSGRLCATGKSSSSNPFQAATASSSAEPYVRHGSFEEMPRADTQHLPAYPEQVSLEEGGELMPVELQAFKEAEHQQTAELEELLQAFVPWHWERTRRVAYQILLRACCFKQEHGMTPSELFAQLIAANDSGLQRVAEAMGLELAQLGQKAEAVLTNYRSLDGKLRLYDMEDLDFGVYAVQLHMCAGMEEMYPHQCHFVKAYGVNKQAVPERFT